MGSLFQQVAQKTGVSNTLENEFKGRASELQRMETDLQAKMKKLQSMKAGSDRTKLEKDRDGSAPDFCSESAGF
ncbi:chaperone protein [Escherichia coli]|uniref:Chaperone protein Skp n=1 Tax=Escherichia coli TaxID=562 RepID=A0A484YMU4_ECOLX|nr:chaperone protein [Escherichia coli]